MAETHTTIRQTLARQQRKLAKVDEQERATLEKIEEECKEPTLKHMLWQQVLTSVQTVLAVWAGFTLTEALNRQLRCWEPAQKHVYVWWVLASLLILGGILWALIPRPKHT